MLLTRWRPVTWFTPSVRGRSGAQLRQMRDRPVPVASSSAPLTRSFSALSRPRERLPPPHWFSALLMKVLHDTRNTVSHFPVGLEHLDNTIETDRLSLILLECVGGTKTGCWLFHCQCTVVPPVETKEQRCSAIPAHQLNSSNNVLFLSHRRGTNTMTK